MLLLLLLLLPLLPVKYCTRKCCQQRRAIFVPDKQNGNVNSVNGTSNFADYFRHTVRTIDPAFLENHFCHAGMVMVYLGTVHK